MLRARAMRCTDGPKPCEEETIPAPLANNVPEWARETNEKCAFLRASIFDGPFKQVDTRCKVCGRTLPALALKTAWGVAYVRTIRSPDGRLSGKLMGHFGDFFLPVPSRPTVPFVSGRGRTPLLSRDPVTA